MLNNMEITAPMRAFCHFCASAGTLRVYRAV
jgi:hypothetical protein